MIHTLNYSGEKITISGIKNVISICDKEAELEIENGKVTINGDGISPQKLEIDDGVIVLNCVRVASINYGGMRKKFSLGKMFK